MLQAAGDLDFEKAAELRDRMLMLEKRDLAVRD
jgi:excinuclease ABC subunit B